MALGLMFSTKRELEIMKTLSGKRNYERLILAIGVLMAAVVVFNFSSEKSPEAEFTHQVKIEVIE